MDTRKKNIYTASRFMARYKLHKLRIFIDKNWLMLFQSMTLERQREVGPSHPNPKVIAGWLFNNKQDESSWSKCQLCTENLEIDKPTLELFSKNGSKKLDLNKDIWPEKNWSSERYYQKKIDILVAKCSYNIEWDGVRFDWIFKAYQTHGWPLGDLLVPELLPKFAGSSWYLYKYKRLNRVSGVERMLLTIKDLKDDSGYYHTFIEAEGDDGKPFTYFSGRVFTDSKGGTAFLLKDFRGRYAHLLLFTEDDPTITDRQICVGHFTYFSHALEGQKNLTKSIVLVRRSPESKYPVKRLILDSDFNSDHDYEKAVSTYLGDRNYNRLTSISHSIFTLEYFKNWVSRAHHLTTTKQSGPPTDYFVYYIKKQHKFVKGIDFDLYMDKMTIFYDPHRSADVVRYDHFAFASKPGDPPHSVFEGTLTKKSTLWYGLLHSEAQNPLFINIHVPEENVKYIECYVGSVSGKEDTESNVLVSYTCVVVPSSVLQNKDSSYENGMKEQIRTYLIREAEAGWAVTAPQKKHVFSFKIDRLDHDIL